MQFAEKVAAIGVDEMALADTVGFGNPNAVRTLFTRVMKAVGPNIPLAAHFHDTRGLGIANVSAAIDVGVRRFDASLCGLGGCPWAPGATGNIVTEDVVFLAESLGFNTGIDLDRLIKAREIVQQALPDEALYGQMAKAGLPKGFAYAEVAQGRMNIEAPVKDGTPVSFALGEDYPELRDAVRAICAKYPGEYWRGLEERSEYPTAFVNDLTAGGYLGGADPAGVWRRRPADPRRRRDPGRDQCRRLHRDAVPRADVHHGDAAAARQRGAEAALSARHRARRIAAAVLRRHRAHDGLRHHAAEDARGAKRATTATSSTARRCGPRARCTPT